MSRSVKKGPFVRGAAPRPRPGDEPTQREAGPQDLVSRERHLPGLRRSHGRRLQRQEAHPGLRDREHGRASAGRVRADADLPRARQAHRALDGAEVGARRASRRHRQVHPPLDAQDAARHPGDRGPPGRRGQRHPAVHAAGRGAGRREGAQERRRERGEQPPSRARRSGRRRRRGPTRVRPSSAGNRVPRGAHSRSTSR